MHLIIQLFLDKQIVSFHAKTSNIISTYFFDISILLLVYIIMYSHKNSLRNQMKYPHIKSIVKKKKGIVILVSIFIILFFLNIPNFSMISFNNQKLTTDKSKNFRNPNISSDGTNSRPLLVYQHTTISNIYYPLSLPSDISFTLIEGWTSKNVTITYDGVSHQKDWVINGTFPTGEAPWEYYDNNSNFIKEAWQVIDGQDCVGITINKGQSFLQGDYSYFEENLTIHEPSALNTLATLSMDYYFIHELGVSSNNISTFVSIDIEGEEKSTEAKFIDLVEESWSEISVTYDLSAYNQLIHGNNENITIRAGVITQNDTSQTPSSKDQRIFFNNIQFTVWTKPSLPNLLIANDIDNNYNFDFYNYTNSTFGKGSAFINESIIKSGSSDITFTILKNNTFTEEFEVHNITITSEAIKIFNSTLNGQEGSLYINNINVDWRTECSFFIPFGYIDNWVEIFKPDDWNTTSILDGFGVDTKGSCTGITLGSERIIIPNGVLSPGLWTLEFTSSNYIVEGGIIVWNGTFFNEESSIAIGDIFQINATLNNTVPFANTQVNCTIKYPNGTIFWQMSKTLGSYNINFGDFTVGLNMSVGNYQTTLVWTNNQSQSDRDKVGFLQFGFEVWHHTSLTAVNDLEEKVSGDPFLMKVNFSDIDSNSYVDFATVTFNSTFGASGDMIYFGSGIYVADLDISGLSLGSYYFSFNASKQYYENQTIMNLVHLRIVSQPLALDVPHEVINADANSYAICQVNVTGAISGSLITGSVNVTTDWQKNYTIIDHLNGSVTLNFSTNHLPLEGIIETYTVTIFANKINYSITSGFISIAVHPIPAVVNVNTSIVEVKLYENFSLNLNYTVGESGELISEAILNVSWVSSVNIFPSGNNYIINFSTTGLSLGNYIVLLRLNHPGYETAFKSVYVTILPLEINVETIEYNNTIEVIAGSSYLISIRLTEEGSGNLIENANITYSWRFEFGEVTNVGSGIYELMLHIPESADGAYIIDIIIISEDVELKNRNFPLNIYVLQKPTPNYLIWIILGVSIAIIGVLSALSLRSYVIAPRKRKKERLFMNTIQVFKDVKNIQAIMLIHKESGMPFFTKNISGFDFEDNFLISGFIQAITLFGKQMIKGEIIDEKKSKHRASYSKTITELDFKFFRILICDYLSLRTVLITKGESSVRLKKQFHLMTVEIEAKYGEKVSTFQGKVDIIQSKIDTLLNEFLFLYYQEPFKLIDDASYMRFLKKGGELQAIESRILNVIISVTKLNKEFTINRIIEEIDEKDVDKIYGGLHTLIQRNIIIPATQKDEDSHPLLGGLK